MSWSFITDVLSLILIISGSLLTLAAAIGIARFKDTMSRVHAVSRRPPVLSSPSWARSSASRARNPSAWPSGGI